MKPRVSHHKTAALTLVEVVVILSVLAILLAILLPALTPHHGGQNINCSNNLKQVGLSFRIWEGDHNDKYPMQVSVTNGGTMELVAAGNVVTTFQVMSNELSTPILVLCPQDIKRQPAATNFSSQLAGHISYFVGLDAEDAKPQTILSGDRNIAGGMMKNGVLEITRNDPVGWSSELHGGIGNIAFADGSVQQTTSRKTSWNLRELIGQTGLATNRLAIP
ncbi:MAG TPA: hypothetical protein DCQ92_07975 [Verrucomicrobia subdivision 3 bacterium]|nr:hypothetical protein [Limisphaerales bacterium]